MGKIRGVIYQTISRELYNPEEAAKYYLYINLIDYDKRYHKPFEEFEINQMNLRNKAIKEAIKDKDIHPNMNSALFGLSSLRHQCIAIADIM